MSMPNRWGKGPGTDADPLGQLVYLSNLVGGESRLVQPGGGNTSIKLRQLMPSGDEAEVLFVKGSGTDLRSIDRAGFTPLFMPTLIQLRQEETMSDPDMMRFMASCMLRPEAPMPSVETPLHSLLPHHVIVHTHDVATMSLTNLADATAERIVGDLFEGRVAYMPYARPGFPLARLVSALLDDLPPEAIGMTLAHHGMVVWADSPEECYARLLDLATTADRYFETCRRGKRVLGARRADPPSPAERRERAEWLLPVLRGALGTPNRVVLHFDDQDDVMDRLASDRFRELARRGMSTPDHILRAGRLPVWLELDYSRDRRELVEVAKQQLTDAREEYGAYHERHAEAGEMPLADWAKVVLVPGVGMVTAFKDRKSAATANACYRAVMESIENAEAVDSFRFLPEADVFEFEHWPLERRKVEESIAKERKTLLLPRHIALVIGGGSGIGAAAARRFAEEGAHVVVADLDGAAAEDVAADISAMFPQRAIGLAVDVRSDESITGLYRRVVLEYGGLDSLFYTAGRPPRFARITDLARADLLEQLDVHYLGAVMAIGSAAQIMQRQGLGGSIVASVSKAAVSPGKDAGAYGGSKAALLQALRVAAVELGEHGIRVNAINADQVETPLFLRFVEERAVSKGISVEEQLETYRRRNLMHASLIPARAVADLAVLLASDRFQYTTGDILTVDGGLPDAFPR